MGIGYSIHVFVCENQREPGHHRGSCADKGSRELRGWFKDLMREHGVLKPLGRANRAGCLNYCELGPTVVVYPQGVWYSVKTKEDVEEIVLSHFKGGKPVERLRIDLQKEGSE